MQIDKNQEEEKIYFLMSFYFDSLTVYSNFFSFQKRGNFNEMVNILKNKNKKILNSDYIMAISLKNILPLHLFMQKLK